jgi:Spy/CpxP family protein refolding chaperone
MKKVALTLVAVLAMALSANLFAQDQQKPDARGDRGAGWMEKMKAARVAFLTTELELTTEEAQNFWPVYNQAQAEKDAAYRETRTAYRALTEAIKEGKPDKEVAALLQAYLKASKVPSALDAEYSTEFLKVLPATKVAKLFISEEKFRKMQFQNTQGPGRGPGMREGQGPNGQGRPGGSNFRGGQGGRGPGMRDGNRNPWPREDQGNPNVESQDL